MKLIPGLSTDVQRGLLLAHQGRHAEAERYYRQALAEHPEDAVALHQLATTLLQIDGRAQEALLIARQAIGLEPYHPDHRALEAFALNQLGRTHDAIEAARRAVEMAPDSALAHSAWAQSYLQQHRWVQAEAEAREALRLEPEDPLAANQLALALRQQNRMQENLEQLRGMLARDPDNPLTHASAGWSALQLGNVEEADGQFLEALRLDPDNESARAGLMSSYRSRTPFYRSYLRYCFAMSRLTAPVQVSVVLGLFLLYLAVQRLANETQSPAIVKIGLLYFVVMLWIWVAEAVGNFFILCDRRARHSLRRWEKIEALTIGSGVLIGIPLAAIGLLASQPIIFFIGLTLLWSAIPFSLVMTNPSRLGRLIFFLLGVISLGSGVAVILIFQFGPEEDRLILPSLVFTVALSTLASTWLGNIPALRRQSTA